MQTSSFFDFKACHLPQAVGIARRSPGHFKGKTVLELAPQLWMLKLNEADFLQAYRERILSKLSPQDVLELVGHDAILCCWEPFNVRCHRRLVAEWIEQGSGIVIPEFGYGRHESLHFEDQQRGGKKKKPAKGKKAKPVLAISLSLYD